LGARLRHVSENHNITVAQEFRSDSAVVLEVAPDQPPACAAIVEPQRTVDPAKWYSWPRYLSDLHHKYRCPTYLVVIALGQDAGEVSAWARQPIATFQPGSGFAPLVLDPSDVPPPSTVEAAKADLPSAALGTLLHLSAPDAPASAYRTLRAVYELHGLDMFVWLYYLIRGIARPELLAETERLIMLQAESGFVPITEFEREVCAKVERERFPKIRAEAKAEAVLAVLAARGLAVTTDQRNSLLACTDAAKLDRLVAEAVAATSVAALLADL
jgi:hypothetical protein